jgi:4-amino-4-deoxy-L-arabinose transferase-like glycosyltransferase
MDPYLRNSKMRAKSSALFYFLALLLIAAALTAAFWQTTSKALYFYDEADYMYAATRGFLSNYLDRPSLSTVEFVRKGLELARDAGQRTNMSEYVRASGDITFYRHYHGPMYAYWIALCHAAGVRDPGTYRASGLLVHLITVTLIFWIFRAVFPAYSDLAAFAAALTFLMNRTALVSATVITQHTTFSLLAGATLFLMARFYRDLEPHYWYATAAALGLAFATVETGVLLVGTIVLTYPVVAFRLGWKNLAGLFLRGAAVFLGAVLVVWPMGILKLGSLKGFVYLGYMALSRKAFSPIGPVQLWVYKFRVYPLEFVIPAIALIACTVSWRNLKNRWEVLPFLVYSWIFVGVTMVVTIPYTHYYGSLLLAGAVLAGVMLGEIELRRIPALRIATLAALVISLAGMTTLHLRERRQPAIHDYRTDLIAYLAKNAGARAVYIPFVLLPTVHFYHPEATAIGYDTDWTGAELAAALSKAGSNGELLCIPSVCDEVRRHMGPVTQTRIIVGGVPVRGQSNDVDVLYSLVAARP